MSEPENARGWRHRRRLICRRHGCFRPDVGQGPSRSEQHDSMLWFMCSNFKKDTERRVRK